MVRFERSMNVLGIFVLSGILLGAFGVQIFMKEEPCPLCFLQRLGMIGVAGSLTLNLWFGIRPSHYGLGLLNALMGGIVALRQISLHVCPGFAAYGLPILGLSLYTWSFLVFVCCVLAIAILLFFYKPLESSQVPSPLPFIDKLVSYLILALSVGNILSAFFICGFGPCQD
jgi:disulfide bond formation protein DsbB